MEVISGAHAAPPMKYVVAAWKGYHVSGSLVERDSRKEASDTGHLTVGKQSGASHSKYSTEEWEGVPGKGVW